VNDQWIALTACAVLIFLFGMAVGVWLLRIELRRNGWRLRLQVDEKARHDEPEQTQRHEV
jgi:hypothetical protein